MRNDEFAFAVDTAHTQIGHLCLWTICTLCMLMMCMRALAVSAPQDINMANDDKTEMSSVRDYFESGTSWLARGPENTGQSPATVLTVCGAGGAQFTSIQRAIDAATSITTVLVFPGTYHEQITGKGGVTVRGLSRDAVVIRYDVQFSTPFGPEDATISWTGSGTFCIENLTAHNLVQFSPHRGSSAVIYSGGENGAIMSVRECSILGSDNDVMNAFGDSTLYVENCRIEMLNNQHDIFYTGHTSTLYLNNIDCYGAVEFGYFVDNAQIIMSNIRLRTEMLFPGPVTGPDVTITYSNIAGDQHVIGDLLVKENIVVDGEFYAAYSVSGQLLKIDTSGGYTPVVNFGYPTETPSVIYDVNLYRGGTDLLKTDDMFEAAALKIGGAEVISAEKVGTFSSVKTSDGPIATSTGFMVGDNKGLDAKIIFTDANNVTHTLTFTGGILTAHSTEGP